MFNYLFRRLNLLVITGFIQTLIAFMLQRWAHPENTAGIVNHYLHFMNDIVHGHWGTSSVTGKSILETGLNAFFATLELCFVAFMVSLFIAIPLGLFAGLHRNTALDYMIMTVALLCLALPVFWLAIMAIMVSVGIDLNLPIDGAISPLFEVHKVSGFLLFDSLLAVDQYGMHAFYNRLAHLLLPGTVLSFFLITEIIRLTRHSITMVMKSNYIKAAYTKGLSRKQIVFRHVLKNALPPIIPQLRLQLSTIISFAMAIEIVFSLQGAGSWLYDNIKAEDLQVLPAAVLIISLFILLSSIVIDILIMSISPVNRKALYADK